MISTPGQLIVNAILPEDLRDYGRSMGKDELDAVLAEVAERYPDRYSEISHKLLLAGGDAAFDEGVTMRLSDFKAPVDTAPYIEHLRKQQLVISRSNLSVSEKAEARSKVLEEVKAAVTAATMTAASRANNPIALQIQAKARGSPTNLAAMVSTPIAFQDPVRGGMVNVPISRSFAQGLTPAQYWASAIPGRKNLIDFKFATRQAGALGKQLNAAAIDKVVTANDCETPYGMPVSADDDDNIGTVLSRPAAGFPAGTVITREVMSGIRQKKVDDIVVRSPTTCAMGDGLCSQCVGVRESGRFPEVGYHVGVNAMSPISERIAQTSLKSKHGGDAGGGGFDVIERFVRIPKAFKEAAALAEADGVVEAVEEAPQGGFYVTVSGNQQYVSHGLEPSVKPGDVVEAGDVLSTGLPNPADIVRHKGIGEGRRYFATKFTELARKTGYTTNRRNVEVMARALIDNVAVEEPEGVGDHLAGDIASYSAVTRNYRPGATARAMDLKSAAGKYLEQPTLHYTIGTRITPSVAKTMSKYGIDSVTAGDTGPGFVPQMLSVTEVPAHKGTWMDRLGGTYLQKRLLKDIQLGSETDIHGGTPLPAIAQGAELGQRRGKIF